MHIKNLVIPAIAALIAGGPVAIAQFSKSTVQGQINSQFPDQNTGQITPATTRAFLNNLVSSYQQYAGVNTQAGATYTVQPSDYGQLIRFNGGNVAVSLSPANAIGTFNFYATNATPGNVVIAPTSGTICGNSVLTLANTQSAWVVSDGTNWQCNFNVNSQLTTPLSVANGGTGGSVASGTLLDNITGFSLTGFLVRGGAGVYNFANATGGIVPSNITLPNLTTLCNPTNTNTQPIACSPGQMSAVLCTPTRLNFVTATNTTYTTPTCNGVRATSLDIEMVGGGGGGGGSGSAAGTAATSGTASCWNRSGTACTSPTYVANGGTGGSNAGTATAAAGGTVVGCTINQSGASGPGSNSIAVVNFAGMSGGSSVYGGAGVGSPPTGTVAGGAAVTNSGAGGGGGGGNNANALFQGAGGGAGGYCRVIIISPSVSYVMTVGTKGLAGGAGTNGAAGGTGADGQITVKASWQ